MAKNIASFPVSDRPYEKLEKMGSRNLTNSELLSIIIKNGTKDKSCLDIAREILSSNTSEYLDDLEYLNSISTIGSLTKIKGIGKVKAIQIIAMLEIARRISLKMNNTRRKVVCPKDAYSVVCDIFSNMKTEMVCIIILDNSCNVLDIAKISTGSVNSVSLGVKEVFSEPIKQMATSIILTHNHPSGNLEASKADINFTRLMRQYGETFNIKVVDHIIVGKNEYISMKEKGYF